MRAVAAAGFARKTADLACRIRTRCDFTVFPFSSCAASGAGEGSGVPHVPVLIVGAGPVGLVLSFLLTKLGYANLHGTHWLLRQIREESDTITITSLGDLFSTAEGGIYGFVVGITCAVLEKGTTFSQHPQAHFINNRTMELFRKLDGLARDIESLQPPVDLWRKFVYCTSLSGSILGSVDHMQSQDFGKIISPVSVAHFSQYKLVNLLLKKLENIGVHVYSSDGFEDLTQGMLLERNILMGRECTSIQLTNEGVMVGVSFSNKGRMEERKYHCSILVGSDGARSTVRKLVGISMKGHRDLQKLVSVHFFSRDLAQYLLNQRPGMLFFIFNPEAIGVLVAHDLNQGEFVLQIPYYPPQQNFEDFTSEVCEHIILKLAGRELMDVQVVDVKPWVMHAEVAEKYVSLNNRVILVGDAAHRFPPAGGFGMNTGIQDAHNLAWKISSLLNDIASPSIMQTYDLERRPIAISNTALSVENFKAAMSVPAALGLDPTVANSVHQTISSSLGSIMPRSLQKVVLEGIFSIGRAQVSDYVLNEKNPLGSLRLARLKSIFDEGKSLQLQFPAEDLGFCYQEGALVSDISNDNQETEAPSKYRRASKEYIPSAKPGARLLHMQVRAVGASSVEDTSTLDLIPGDKLEFLLIIAPLGESYDIARVMLKTAEIFKVSLKVSIIWPPGSFNKEVTSSRIELDPWTNFIDVEEVRRASVNSWWEMCHMTNRGIILVRPDEHIAWRAESDTVEDAAAEARRVFSLILGMKRT